MTVTRKSKKLDGSNSSGTKIVIRAARGKPKLEQITLSMWVAANSRIMHELLRTGNLSASTSDIAHYLAYTVKFAELLESHTLASAVAYDNQYHKFNTVRIWLSVRAGQGFWVYGIQGLFKSGVRYISAEIWVFGISCFLNFRYKVYLPFLSLWLHIPLKRMNLDRFMLFKNKVQLKVLIRVKKTMKGDNGEVTWLGWLHGYDDRWTHVLFSWKFSWKS